MTRVSTCRQASHRKVRNSGWTPNFGKVATCVIGAAQFGQLISDDVSAPERFIDRRDYAGRTRAALIQVNSPDQIEA